MTDRIVQLQDEDGNNVFPICKGMTDDVAYIATQTPGTALVSSSDIDWSTMCSGAETVTTAMGATYTKFYQCTNSIRSVFGGHGFDFAGYIDFGGSSGAATINKTAIPGMSGYYGFKTQCQVPITPNNAMMFTSYGFSYRYTPGQSSGGDRWGSTDLVSSFAVGTDGYIYIHASTASSISISAWDRILYRYPGGIHMIDH